MGSARHFFESLQWIQCPQCSVWWRAACETPRIDPAHPLAAIWLPMAPKAINFRYWNCQWMWTLSCAQCVASFLVIVPNCLGFGGNLALFSRWFGLFWGRFFVYIHLHRGHVHRTWKTAARWAMELRLMRISVFMMAECELLGVEPNR